MQKVELVGPGEATHGEAVTSLCKHVPAGHLHMDSLVVLLRFAVDAMIHLTLLHMIMSQIIADADQRHPSLLFIVE